MGMVRSLRHVKGYERHTPCLSQQSSAVSAPWPGFLSSSSSFTAQVRRVMRPRCQFKETNWEQGILSSLLSPQEIICFSFTGSFSQPVLTQSPTASASLGASVKLTCTLSSDYSTNTIYWYQQQPDKAPKYLMYVYSSGHHGKGDGIPDRFSGSSSGAQRYLSISNIQPEDEADYFCGVT